MYIKKTLGIFKSKYQFKKILLFSSCLFLLAACDKEENLNPTPSTLITDETAFSSTARIQNQVNGLYATLKSSGFLGSFYYIASDIRAGDFISSNMNAATGATTYQMLTQTTTSDVITIWEDGYQDRKSVV